MEIRIRNDAVEITGYVNAVERLSRPLPSRQGDFKEMIMKGAFKSALSRNDDVKILLDHKKDRVLGSQKQGNLELEEDPIGLKVKATISDPEVVKEARNGDLVGWSFGFYDRDVDGDVIDGYPIRKVKDLDLEEVSIIDRKALPAYEGTLIQARADEKPLYFGCDMIDNEVNLRYDCKTYNGEVKKEPEKSENGGSAPEKVLDYSKWDTLIKDMKEEQ